jgi:hypothetical protein
MLVPEDREIRLVARHGGGAGEEAFVGHVDGVGRGPVVRLLAAMHDPGAGCGEETVGVEDALDGAERFGRGRRCVALHLRAVEHPGRPRHAALAVILGDVWIGVGVVLLIVCGACKYVVPRRSELAVVHDWRFYATYWKRYDLQETMGGEVGTNRPE